MLQKIIKTQSTNTIQLLDCKKGERLRALPVHPNFEDKKRQTKNVHAKNRIKKTALPIQLV